MKRFVIAAAAIALFGAASAHAAVIGNVYSSDILAKINGVAVESVNIGGKTAIVLEDLDKFGAKLRYNDAARQLTVDLRELKLYDTGVERGTVGKIVDKIWQSDITAVVNDRHVPTFSLNGKLAAAIEDMAATEPDYSTNIGALAEWDAESRTVSMRLALDNTQELPNIFAPHKTLYKIFIDGHMEAYEYKFDDLNHWDKDIEVIKEWGAEPSELTFNGRDAGRWDIIGGQFSYEFKPENIHSEQKYTPRTREEVIACYDEQESYYTDEEPRFWVVNSRILDRFDTEDYTFLSTGQSTPHGWSAILVQIFNDGSVKSYSKELARSIWGIAVIENLKINEEEQTVTFVNGPYARCIDLKTGEFTSTPLE